MYHNLESQLLEEVLDAVCVLATCDVAALKSLLHFLLGFVLGVNLLHHRGVHDGAEVDVVDGVTGRLDVVALQDLLLAHGLGHSQGVPVDASHEAVAKFTLAWPRVSLTSRRTRS